MPEDRSMSRATGPVHGIIAALVMRQDGKTERFCLQKPHRHLSCSISWLARRMSQYSWTNALACLSIDLLLVTVAD